MAHCVRGCEQVAGGCSEYHHEYDKKSRDSLVVVHGLEIGGSGLRQDVHNVYKKAVCPYLSSALPSPHPLPGEEILST
jgi:hypothetical protein